MVRKSKSLGLRLKVPKWTKTNLKNQAKRKSKNLSMRIIENTITGSWFKNSTVEILWKHYGTKVHNWIKSENGTIGKWIRISKMDQNSIMDLNWLKVWKWIKFNNGLKFIKGLILKNGSYSKMYQNSHGSKSHDGSKLNWVKILMDHNPKMDHNSKMD